MSPDPAAATCPATPSLEDATIGIVVSDWHSELTSKMLESAIAELKRLGVENDDIFIAHVPSAMELVYAAKQMAIVQDPKAVIMIGCCTNDECSQYGIVAQSFAYGFSELNLHGDIPYINGVIFTPTIGEAQSRCTEAKGVECVVKVSSMVNMMANLVII